MSQVFRNIPDPTLEAVAKGVDFAKLTNLKEESGMSDDEWKNAMVAIEKTRAGATAEDNRGSQLVLARRQQFARSVLSPWPVIVIRCNVARDYTLLYNAGVAMVNGTQAERASALDFIDRFQLFDDDLRAAQLRLPKCNRYVHHEYMGHDYVIRHPEAVVPDVKWVMEHQKAEL
ncbi:hypothetical protein B0A50_00719 [Salinomyces thailandicus]|uniref:Uncharacterized protein n=1 Tax=Salinomyces thailandicus TaxID=706561 RepID=A0A4U0UEY3_9PEZI|nr:hypothetical protein B0A50_00719 [Salinomyces thailandica]